eukprot:TRINITY_DN4085_c0_g1_i1.p1 TRINITY_DN4085_c0_g1~~TRINITY_DN4085_c0_g1_i1.p1  ORF type:complete len:322 (+),score=28.75 TRINITY_DN4085_c0_g1_i1:146-1111(+)
MMLPLQQATSPRVMVPQSPQGACRSCGYPTVSSPRQQVVVASPGSPYQAISCGTYAASSARLGNRPQAMSADVPVQYQAQARVPVQLQTPGRLSVVNSSPRPQYITASQAPSDYTNCNGSGCYAVSPNNGGLRQAASDYTNCNGSGCYAVSPNNGVLRQVPRSAGPNGLSGEALAQTPRSGTRFMGGSAQVSPHVPANPIRRSIVAQPGGNLNASSYTQPSVKLSPSPMVPLRAQPLSSPSMAPRTSLGGSNQPQQVLQPLSPTVMAPQQQKATTPKKERRKTVRRTIAGDIEEFWEDDTMPEDQREAAAKLAAKMLSKRR